MKVTKTKIDDLKPFDKNPRINEVAVEVVKTSIKENGFNQPIVCDQDMVICVGHTRWLAAKELGLKTVPVYVKEMTPAQFKAYNLADNKSHEYASWDNDLLAELLKEIEAEDEALLKATAFSDDELDALLDDSDLDDLVGDVDVEGYTRSTPGEKSHVKMVQIFLDDITFPKFIEMVEDLQHKLGTSNMTDTVYQCVEMQHEGQK